LQKIRQDLKIQPIRGNVETRVKKVISGEFDAIILAEAGLTRMGMQDMIAERFPIRSFMPAPGQGAIGIVCRAEDKKTAAMLKKAEDPRSKAEVLTERALIRSIEGGCRFPLGAIALVSGDNIDLRASVFSADGSKNIKVRKQGPFKEPEKLGNLAAQALVSRGAMEFAKGWREAVKDWNSKV
jgi:hydroxymethylbilane synthase